MSYIVEYLKPMKKKFYKKHLAEKFIKEQYKTIRFLEFRDGVYFCLQLPVPLPVPSFIQDKLKGYLEEV